MILRFWKTRVSMTRIVKVIWLSIFIHSLSIATAQVNIPPTPAGKTLGAFLDAFNEGDRRKLEVYVKTYDPTNTAENLASFHDLTGGFALLSIVQSAPDSISFRVRGKSDHLEAYGNLQLTGASPPKVKSLLIRLIPPGATIENITLDEQLRQSTIAAIGKFLMDYYVYADVAQKMTQTMQDH
jgi:hypothetical protein